LSRLKFLDQAKRRTALCGLPEAIEFANTGSGSNLANPVTNRCGRSTSRPGTIAPVRNFTAAEIFCASLNGAMRAETPLASADAVIYGYRSASSFLVVSPEWVKTGHRRYSGGATGLPPIRDVVVRRPRLPTAANADAELRALCYSAHAWGSLATDGSASSFIGYFVTAPFATLHRAVDAGSPPVFALWRGAAAPNLHSRDWDLTPAKALSCSCPRTWLSEPLLFVARIHRGQSLL